MAPEIHPRRIEYYIDDRGRRPFREWLEALKDIRAQVRIRVKLDRLALGYFGDCRSVGEGVLELKINFGPGYRVYFGLDKGQVVLLLCGGDKGSQTKDIQKAYQYWTNHRRLSHAKET
jgi:putative addiction module killer protein